MSTVLQTIGLFGGYGGTDILNGVELAANAGELAVVVGPNGAGKSTALKALFGLVHLRAGSVLFEGQDITRMPPERRVGIGMAFVPQERNVFPSLSVRENLEMGGYTLTTGIAERIEHVFELFPDLRAKAHQPAGQLSGGQRQMVAMGRAMMTSPRLLLLDEPTAGLSPKVMGLIFDRIKAVGAAGVAVLMVEQNARQALAIADVGYVLATGRNRFTGAGPELLATPDVARSFLGG